MEILVRPFAPFGRKGGAEGAGCQRAVLGERVLDCSESGRAGGVPPSDTAGVRCPPRFKEGGTGVRDIGEESLRGDGKGGGARDDRVWDSSKGFAPGLFQLVLDYEARERHSREGGKGAERGPQRGQGRVIRPKRQLE